MGIPRRAIGWVVTGLFTLGVVPVIQQFVSKLTEEWGWYERPAAKVGTVTAFFATIISSGWFYPALAFVAGAAALYWASEWFLPKPVVWTENAHLTLTFDSELGAASVSRQENVRWFYWYHFPSVAIDYSNKAASAVPGYVMIFLVLKDPTHTNYSRVTVAGGGIMTEVLGHHATGATIRCQGNMQGRTVDVAFSKTPIPL